MDLDDTSRIEDFYKYLRSDGYPAAPKTYHYSTVLTKLEEIVDKSTNTRLKHSFPFDEYHHGQELILDELDKHFVKNSDIRYGVLELPTGIGKSVISVTLANFYSGYDIHTKIITKTKLLQLQYQNDFSHLKSLIGKGNYPDLESFDDAVDQFINANIGITNFANLRHSPHKEILIVDEGHEFAEFIHHNLYVNLPKVSANMYLNRIIQFLSDKKAVRLQWILRNTVQAFFYEVGLYKKSDGKYKINPSVSALYGAVKILVECPDTYIRVDKNAHGFSMYFDNAKEYVRVLLGSHPKVLFLSANYGGIEFFLNMLGKSHEDEDTYIKSIQESPFKPENRPIEFYKIHSNGSANKTQRMKKVVCEVLDNILDHEYSETTNGIVHTVSYENSLLVKQFSRYSHKMLIIKDKAGLYDLVDNNKGLILLSPSMEEGVSFSGDRASYQFLLKCPLEPNSGCNKFLVSKYGRQYLNRKSAMRITQSSGRINRSYSDEGTTYIIDANFGRVLGKGTKRFYPKYIWDNFKTFKKLKDHHGKVKLEECTSSASNPTHEESIDEELEFEES